MTASELLPERRWAHQLAAAEFVRNLWENGRRGAMLAMAMGCIDGDATVVVHRHAAVLQMTLRELYYKLHGGKSQFGGREVSWKPEVQVRTRALVDGRMRPRFIQDVIARGVKPVIRLTLASGKWLRLTPDHLVSAPEDWIAAGKLKPGNRVWVDPYYCDSVKLTYLPRPEAVLSVEPDGETAVYDITMAGNGDLGHNFAANGIVVHNCGKSRVAVDLAAGFDIPLVLVLCPLRVVEVWRQQFARFAPGRYLFLALDDHAGTVREKARQARDMVEWGRERRQPVVIATNYESARHEPLTKFLLSKIWGLAILDESHRIKDPSGRTSQICGRLGLNSHYRLCLTGTPMPHQPIDIWAQFRFLDRTILDPTYGSIKLRHGVMGGYMGKQIVGWRDLDQLRERVATIAFRVDDDVLDLPPEHDETLTTEMTATGARVYREMEREMIAWVRTEEEAGRPVTAANAMVRLIRLQQITGGTVPDESGAGQQVDDAKERLLADFLQDLPPDEPVVVFALYHSDLDAIHSAAASLGRTSGELSGRPRGHRGDLDRWQAGQLTVLAVQIQAGSVGIDLTRSRIAVYYSLGFSLADYLQSRKRIRRPPQQRACAFYHLQIRNSIDQSVLAAVEARQDLIESVLKELKQRDRSPQHPGA